MEHEHPNPNKQDDPKSSPVALAAFIGTVLVIASVYGLTAMYYRQETNFVRETYYDQPQKDVLSLYATQDAEIGHYRWIDREKGLIGVPIEVAMKSVIREIGRPGAKPPAESPMQ